MKHLTIFILLGFLFSACGPITRIIPPYTNVEKITSLETNMSVEKVNEILAIPAYDIYHLEESGTKILSYNYRLKNRKHTTFSLASRSRHNEKSQTAGKAWYSKKSYQVYILFKDNQMKSLITDVGRKNSEALHITGNTLELLSTEEMKLYDLTKIRYLMEYNEESNNKVIPLFGKRKKKKKK